MSEHASRHIRSFGQAVHATWTDAVARGRRLPVGTIALALVIIAWLAASGWWAFVQPRSEEAAEQRYQEAVAKCRELPTSEARYECVSRTLIGRDRENFGKSLVVFIPPLVLLFGRYVWRERREARRERERERRAEIRSRRLLAQVHQELAAEREALKPAKRPGWDVETSWADEIARAPRKRVDTAHPTPHAPGPHGPAPHAIKRA